MGNSPGNGGVPFTVICQLCPADPPSFRVESPRRLPETWWEHMIREHPLACDRVRIRFPGYLDGQMAFHGDRRVVAHLASCGICAAMLRMMERQMVRKEFGPTVRMLTGMQRSGRAVTAGERA